MDLSTILPRILIVSGRSVRKNKFVDFVGEYYLDLIVGYGAVPVIVPRVNGVHMLLESFEPVQGILLCEGEDIDPSLYEPDASGLSPEDMEEIRRLHVSDTAIDREKDSIELRLAKLCLERNIPYLGICRGSQVLNVACGGTLYQDIETELTKKFQAEKRVAHINYGVYDGHRHSVKVVEKTPLHSWFKDSLDEGNMEVMVNSYHHQGVKKLAQRFVPMAFAPEGLIEGFYDPDAYKPEEGKFIMGLQFHPERMRKSDIHEFDYPGCPSAYQEFVKLWKGSFMALSMMLLWKGSFPAPNCTAPANDGEQCERKKIDVSAKVCTLLFRQVILLAGPLSSHSPHNPPVKMRGHSLWRTSILLLLLAATATLPLSAATAAAAPSPSPPVTAIPSNCSNAFDCGPLRNLSYPFTGGNRPAYCGIPDFRLTCHGNQSAELTTGSMRYRVLDINQTTRSLTMARSDLYNNTCLSNSTYNNTTLNSTFFIGQPENEDLTIFYGCSSIITIVPPNMFNCEINGSSSKSYYLMGPVPYDPVLNVSKCNVSVSVPILQSSAAMLTDNRSLLKEALMKGFAVNYTVPYEEECIKCRRILGECVFNSTSGGPICICSGSGVCSVSGKDRITLGIVLALSGAGFTGILLGFWIFSQRAKKRKLGVRHASAASSADGGGGPAHISEIREISGPPLSKAIFTTSTTNYSPTIPSYPSSKCDLENGSTYFGVQVFSYEELEEATQNFNPARELGDGGFGTVYYGQKKKSHYNFAELHSVNHRIFTMRLCLLWLFTGELRDGRAVAVKRLYENNMRRLEQFMNEVEILTRLRHDNLVRLFGCTSRRSRELLLVYEFIPNGTVADHLHGKRASSGFLRWETRLNIAMETADALACLHENDVIHRDVKTNNILLDDDFHVKVADFGLSRLFPNDVSHVSTAPQGTPGYVDPEYYLCYRLTDKSDVYSFGVVLSELLSSKPAVDTSRHRHDVNLANMAVNKIQSRVLHELVDPVLGFETDYQVKRMTTLVAELAFQCLQQEKDTRPTMLEVLEALRRIKNGDKSLQSDGSCADGYFI
ncbi:hypothetical protein SAY87_008922 [Trapa incisa]|uniref:non-specific serine/threonine protein kinase n=1 Tax=Trapa incisa TaxID=236973 RepID=A0AAN7Q1M6_9MYRT|nr:hypothetical protein SAY87_008922 [Trapa incisa]